jgi:hypothetical protein
MEKDGPDHLMAENITKIIKTSKWGKSNQKKGLLYATTLEQMFSEKIFSFL